jgi:hypothetical protein
MNDWLTELLDFAPCVVSNKEHNFRNLIYSSPQVERVGRGTAALGPTAELFLGPSAELREGNISFVMSLSICVQQLCSHWTDFHQI